MANGFYNIYKWGEKNKMLFLALTILFVGFTSIGLWKIKFEEDILRILPKSEKSNVTTKVLSQLSFSDKITVIIEKKETGNTEDMIQFATVFLDSLANKKEYIKNIQGKVEEESVNQTIAFVYDHLPLFLDKEDYFALDKKITIDSIAETVEQNYKTLISPTGMVAKQFIQKDPFGIGFIALQKLQQLNIGNDFHLVDGFLLNKDESKLLLFIDPVYGGSETAHNTFFINALKKLKEDMEQTYSETVSLDYFGASFVAVANADQIKSDIQKTVVISISILMLLLVVFYRRIFIPVILFIPTGISALLALLILYFVNDTISAISLSVGAILIGITIDYALHIMTHYKHCRDIKMLYREITKPILMSAATTAIAFLCLVFVHSDALRDLGIFASVTVMGAGVFSLLLIPHLYKPSAKDKNTFSSSLLDKAANFPFDKNKVLLGVCVLVIALSCFTFNKVGFDRDISSLNYFPSELKNAEKKLEATLDSEAKSLYLTCFGDDIETVLQQNETLYHQLLSAKENGAIMQFSSLGDFVLSARQQQERIEMWNAFWQKKDRIDFKTGFIKEGEKYGFNETAYQPFFALLNTSFEPINIRDFSNLNPQIFNEFFTENEGFFTLSTVVKVAEDKRLAFVESFPATDHFLVIDRKEMNETFLGNIVRDFNHLVNYSFIAVFLVLWIFYRRIELAIVCMIPISVTGFITVGLMGLFQLDFNVFSTIVCTLIFGQGIDFTIFMTNALQKEYTTGQKSMSTYRASIILAVLTTILAVGTLIFAKHPALRSISFISIIGMGVAAATAFVIYPRIFRLCFINRQKKGNSPITLRLLLHSLISFFYFWVYGFLYSVIAKIFLLITPGQEKQKLRCFSKGMHGFMKSVLYSNPFVKKKVRNPYGETFTKPAVIIANHTSFLDSLTIGMTYPYVVFLVNDWVYNSAVYGRAIRMAGFYPVSEGVEKSVMHLKKRTELGFSLMIFPEGTRSGSNEIQRFHKGAFFLAETLGLDIIPIYIHGNSEIMPKNDYIIYDGHIITTIGKRIKSDDLSFGNTYAERTKSISKYYKAEFANIREELEDVDYFKKKLYLTYLYKYPEIVKEVKSDFKKYKYHYFNLNKYITAGETVFHLANDFGQLDIMLTLQQSKRKIYSWIADEQKREVALNNYLVQKRKIKYVSDFTRNKKINTLLVSDGNAIIPDDFVVDFQKIILLKKNGVDLSFAKEYEVMEDNEYVKVWKKR